MLFYSLENKLRQVEFTFLDLNRVTLVFVVLPLEFYLMLVVRVYK